MTSSCNAPNYDAETATSITNFSNLSYYSTDIEQTH